jgi:hypothetical protein
LEKEKTPVTGPPKPLAERGTLDRLDAPEVEVAVHGAGFGGYVGAALSHRLVELCPISAWQLRHGMGEARQAGVKGPRGQAYIAKVIRGLRERGERPPPGEPSAAQAAAGGQPRPGPTIADKRASDAGLWREAAKSAGYPPDEAWVAEQGDKGAPEPDDLALLDECGGDWARYRARVDAARSETFARLRALAGGIG